MSGKFNMKAHEKRFFDPQKVLERDEGGEKEQTEFDREEALKNDESFANMADIRKHDQLNNTISAWNDELSTRLYNYPKDDIEKSKAFAEKYADDWCNAIAKKRVEEDPLPGFNHDPEFIWEDRYNDGLGVYDRCKEYDLSDDGMTADSKDFERHFSRPYLFDKYHNDVDAQKNMLSTDDEDVDQWIRAGYQSGDMFGEAIDKIAKVTGQKELCEAVKQIYKVCTESESRDARFQRSWNYGQALMDKISYLGRLVYELYDNYLQRHQDDSHEECYWDDNGNMIVDDIWSNMDAKKIYDTYGPPTFRKIQAEAYRVYDRFTPSGFTQFVPKVDKYIADVETLLKRFRHQ